MTMFGSQWLANAGSTYKIAQSCRFNDNDSAYTTQTFAGSGTGTGNTCTYSLWLKRGTISSSQYFFSVSAGNPYFIGFQANDTLRFTRASGGSPSITTTAVFRDCSAWYHIVLTIDTSLTAVDRWKIYVNNVRQTVTTGGTLAVTPLGTAVAHYIGRYVTAASYFDGYMSEINFVDGTALDPSSFGETNDDGVWVPIKYTGAYGTNGFYLDFADSSDFGSDQSGNGNDFTDSGLATNDQMLDTPTNNFCTLNPVDTPAETPTLSNGNLDYAYSAGNSGEAGATILIPATGKWVFEVTAGTAATIAIVLAPPTWQASTSISAVTDGVTIANDAAGTLEIDNVAQSGSDWTGTQVLRIEWNRDTNTIELFIDGTTSTAGTYSWDGNGEPIQINVGRWNLTATASLNFGAQGFAGTPTAGFKALNTSNLPEPTIKDGSAHFQTTLYTGNGTAIGSGGKVVSGLEFQPDLTWVKGRSGAHNNILTDVVRGVTNYLVSDAASNESTNAETLAAFNSDGFTLGSAAFMNTNTATYVAWNWLAGGAGSSNTDGDITSTVSANTTAGFSIATFTGNGTQGATVGHGLGVAPKMMIVKARTTAGADYGWFVYHAAVASDAATDHLILNTTAAVVDDHNSWDDTAPTSAVFSIGGSGGGGAGNLNVTGNTLVAYCFAEVEGYSKFGSYAANNLADGPFIYTGFKPAFVMIKCTAASRNWIIIDTAQNTYNVCNPYLAANTSAAVGTTNNIDILSNGFKVRVPGTTFYDINIAGGTMIYMAFAENPFGGANTAPATAR
jgi:hypothetical protein